MKKRIIGLFCLIVFLFGGCSDDMATATIPESTEATTEAIPYYLTEVYSEYAYAQFLDFESSSWEREYKPEFIMIHFTSAVVLDRDDPYDPQLVRSIFEDYEIGIHYVIERDGNIVCYLPENRAAWHAGEGEYDNDPRLTDRMNMYSIGIEVLAIGSEADMSQYLSSDEYNSLDDEFYGYTDAQYESLKLLVDDICLRQDIPLDRYHIIGHEEYSSEKTDPGELFEWNRIVAEQTKE